MKTQGFQSALDMLADEIKHSKTLKNYFLTHITNKKKALNTNVTELEIDYKQQIVTIYDELLMTKEPVVHMSIAAFVDFLNSFETSSQKIHNQTYEDIIINRLLHNKDDLLGDTFCYKLFKEGVFDAALCEDFLHDVQSVRVHPRFDKEIRPLLEWILPCVDQYFASHKDADDLFFIKNYSKSLEQQWEHYASCLRELLSTKASISIKY